jgi:hypothetical protein
MSRPKQRPTRRSPTRTPRRRQETGWQILATHASDQPLGYGVISATLEETLEAMAAQPPDLPWSSMSTSLLPLIPRVRPYPVGMDDGVRTMAPPGITVGFGVDIGPGFITVTPALLDRWSVSIADVMACAIANVHARAALVDPASILVGGRDGVRTEWLQTDRSIGSVLVVAPTELARLFGPEPHRFITPMRDLIVGFPVDADPELVRWHYDEVASLDPNCLGPTSYVLREGRVIPEPLWKWPGSDLSARLA